MMTKKQNEELAALLRELCEVNALLLSAVQDRAAANAKLSEALARSLETSGNSMQIAAAALEHAG